ncbi:hypothetical protein AADU03_005095 [Escherichia coli]
MAADNSWAKAALLLLLPAAVHVVSTAWQNSVSQGFGGEQFFGNYLFMAAPHLLMACLAAVSVLRRDTLLQVLIGLNLVLIAFTFYLHGFVPPREAGLAWVLYYPLCLLFLLGDGIVRFVARRGRA